MGSRVPAGDPPDSGESDSVSMDQSPVPQVEVPPSVFDVARDLLKKSRLGRMFKRTAPYL